MRRILVNGTMAMVLVLAMAGCIQKRDVPAQVEGETIKIFVNNSIHFNPDNPDEFASGGVASLDNGRVIETTVNMPEHDRQVKIIAHVVVHPIPKDEISVHDKWDRAGNIRLGREGMADVEIVKFITAYGGKTEYDVDVSHLAPLLNGQCTFKGFIDTWVSPGWIVDFNLTFIPDRYANNPDWTEGVMFVESYERDSIGDDGITVEVEVPDGMKQVTINYLVSGHCTDGRDADEFVSKDNVIYVDGREVIRFKPWRDDCLQFRAINPYCRRWSDGTWSSDYSRSGWCPGDIVEPVAIDMTPYLTDGKHSVRFVIEDVRPKDELGHLGYWRISSHVLGWTK